MLLPSVTSDRSRRTGLILVLAGLIGALVPFVGPSFGYGMGGSPAWTWTESHATRHLAPGLAAMIGGFLIARGAERATQINGALLAAAGGTWFIIGPSLHPLWAKPSMDGMSGMGDSALSSALSALGYHYGTGVVIALFAAYALGLLVAARTGTERVASDQGQPAWRPTTDSPLVDAQG